MEEEFQNTHLETNSDLPVKLIINSLEELSTLEAKYPHKTIIVCGEAFYDRQMELFTTLDIDIKNDLDKYLLVGMYTVEFVRYAGNILYVSYNGHEIPLTFREVRRFTLREWLGSKIDIYSCGSATEKLLDIEIVKEFSSVRMKWDEYLKELRTHAPFKAKNIYSFVVLANGKAVGHNENPSRGWSFPVITYKGKI